jgi:hypothetical protein
MRGRPKIFIGKDREIRNLQLRKKELKPIPFLEFKNWYNLQNDCCIYCRLSSFETNTLYNKFPKSTRNGKRGKSLELDRKNQNIKNYSVLENLCLACYWCNNAKTNYFSFDEFMIIGNVINQIQKNKLLNP